MTEPKDMTEQPESEPVGIKEQTTQKLHGGVTGKGFMPGQSGNPSGRPKKLRITEIYEELLDDPEIREAIKQAAKKRMLSDRMVGAIEMERAADRVEGKVQQNLKLEGELGLSTISERVKRARERTGQ